MFFSFKRDIYYNDVTFFGTQAVVDHAVDDISCMLDVPRHYLHVVSIRPSKSKIYGDVTQDDFQRRFLMQISLHKRWTLKVRLHDATKLMRRATKWRCVNGLICATCDCCMLSQES